MAVASLVLGIFSILFVFTGPFSIIAVILGGIGIVLGAQARKKERSDIATGGLVTSIVGCALAMLLNLACVACFTGGKKLLDEAFRDPQFKQSVDDFTKRLKELEKEANKKANQEAEKSRTFQ